MDYIQVTLLIDKHIKNGWGFFNNGKLMASHNQHGVHFFDSEKEFHDWLSR